MPFFSMPPLLRILPVREEILTLLLHPDTYSWSPFHIWNVQHRLLLLKHMIDRSGPRDTVKGEWEAVFFWAIELRVVRAPSKIDTRRGHSFLALPMYFSQEKCSSSVAISVDFANKEASFLTISLTTSATAFLIFGWRQAFRKVRRGKSGRSKPLDRACRTFFFLLVNFLLTWNERRMCNNYVKGAGHGVEGDLPLLIKSWELKLVLSEEQRYASHDSCYHPLKTWDVWPAGNMLC